MLTDSIGGYGLGEAIMKLIAFAASAALALGLGFAPSPARAFTMTFDEFGGCSSSAGTCSSFIGPDPSNLVTDQNVLLFTLPSLVFSGQIDILDAQGASAIVCDGYHPTPATSCNVRAQRARTK